MDQVVAKHPPSMTETQGDLTVLVYGIGYTRVVLVASTGRLVFAYAASCTWSHVFFDQMTEAQKKAVGYDDLGYGDR